MHRFRSILIVLLISALPSFIQSDTFKVGVVSLSKLIATYPGTQEAQLKLEQTAQQRENEVSGIAGEIKELQKDYVANKTTYTAKQKKEKEYLIRKKSEDFEKQRSAIMNELKAQEEMVTQKVMGDIRKIINDVASEENVNMVVDVEQNLFLKDPIDITDKVIKKFEKSGKKSKK